MPERPLTDDQLIGLAGVDAMQQQSYRDLEAKMGALALDLLALQKAHHDFAQACTKAIGEVAARCGVVQGQLEALKMQVERLQESSAGTGRPAGPVI